ncbi:MAG: hypothetical protein Q7S42_01160 [Candidatus Omnitrophota bacterium]|nr:hypothetical protein [Candidatus Omnitrophota bacterium]
MEFDAVRKDLKTLTFETLRTDCDNFFEGVIIQQELDKLNSQLKNLLGEPVYPSKNRLTFKVKETVDGLGGIMPGQTLYYKNLGKDGIFAMLWPWKDGQRTTVKVILQ